MTTSTGQATVEMWGSGLHSKLQQGVYSRTTSRHFSLTTQAAHSSRHAARGHAAALPFARRRTTERLEPWQNVATVLLVDKLSKGGVPAGGRGWVQKRWEDVDEAHATRAKQRVP